MSHVRNLLNAPVKLALGVTSSTQPALPQPVPAREEAPREFPVERAHIRPEARIAYYTDPKSAAADRFRYLRMRLRELGKARKLSRLLVTSPLAGDGKSTMILNLATALSEHGKRSVLVVEADLHHASLAKDLGLPAWPGLTDCLTSDLTSPLSLIRRIDPLGWCLLPAGEPRGNPAELLQTPAFGNILERVSKSFEWILIDSPPALAFTDAISLHQHADGSLVVARAGKTPGEAIEQAVVLLGPPKVLGVLLNGVENESQISSVRSQDMQRA